MHLELRVHKFGLASVDNVTKLRRLASNRIDETLKFRGFNANSSVCLLYSGVTIPSPVINIVSFVHVFRATFILHFALSKYVRQQNDI